MPYVYEKFLDLFMVPANSIGIPVPTGIRCPLDEDGEKLLTSYLADLRQGDAPDAEVEVVAELARLGRMKIHGHKRVRTYKASSWWNHMGTVTGKADLANARARRCLECFFDTSKEFFEVFDHYGNVLKLGRINTIPQIPKMTIEVHRPPTNEDVLHYLSYEAEPEHSAMPPLPEVKTVSQLAQLASSELSEYLKFFAIEYAEDADRNTKLELLKKETGIDCIGEAEFSDEPLTDHERRALSNYLQCVGAQLTDDEAKAAKYTNVWSADEETPYNTRAVQGPCEMFRQRRFAADKFHAVLNNHEVPRLTRSELLSNVPDWYGNVPSSGRELHIPAQTASRTPVHIPGVDRVFRYIVLDAIVDHPKVEPLQALTRVRQVMQLTPDQVNQYLKFYCVEVPENADIDQRLHLLKVELGIDHIGPAEFRMFTGLELGKRKMGQDGEAQKKLKEE